ncbi:MAG: L,D-transpeptidase family protein [Hyphomicrobiaceae bacterium]|nr:L,D-transpeptidase family protein [Hyphomicrobiaceae bacterium]
MFGRLSICCALGRSGCGALKREGDGKTPIGSFQLREVLYRPDRVGRPRTRLPVRPIKVGDGWCDATTDRNYNRPVKHPYPASAERLWRDDALYDIVLVIGFNDRPRQRGLGSAIFVHVARPGFLPTEGCVALTRHDLTRLLRCLRPRDRLRVHHI